MSNTHNITRKSQPKAKQTTCVINILLIMVMNDASFFRFDQDQKICVCVFDQIECWA